MEIKGIKGHLTDEDQAASGAPSPVMSLTVINNALPHWLMLAYSAKAAAVNLYEHHPGQAQQELARVCKQIEVLEEMAFVILRQELEHLPTTQ